MVSKVTEAALEVGAGAAPAAKVLVDRARPRDRPDGRSGRRRWPARSRSARPAAACRCRRTRWPSSGCARPWCSASTSTLPKFFSKMSKPAMAGDQADMDVGPGGLRGGLLEIVERLRHGSVPLQPVLEQRRAAGRAARCRSGRRAQSSGIEALRSSGAIRRSSASLSGIVVRIGQSGISGSPSKYIWVISRCAKPEPNTEKWMCAGRQLLTQLRQG